MVSTARFLLGGPPLPSHQYVDEDAREMVNAEGAGVVSTTVVSPGKIAHSFQSFNEFLG